ncbi:MAG: Nif3-like dinuclear metal center hexameric protein [Nocardioides sp.]
MRQPRVGDVIALMESWFPTETAMGWDAVGLVAGDPEAALTRVLLAVDPTRPVVAEAAALGAELLICHHPLFLRPVHGFSTLTPKGRTMTDLGAAGCALYVAHTNADIAPHGVSEALAQRLGIGDLRPIVPSAPVAGGTSADGGAGIGRVGSVPPQTLRAYAEQVAAALPPTAQGVRVAGDPDRIIERVAVLGGAGDDLFDAVVEAGADVYVTSDLRHHPAAEFLERGQAALIDIAHWAGEWAWLPVLAERLRAALAESGATVEVHVSSLVTDPWTFRV